MILRIYDVSDLLDPADRGSFTVERLASLLTIFVAPASWKTMDGPGHIEDLPHHRLAVSQTFRLHEDVEAFLFKLRDNRGNSPAAPHDSR